MGKKGGYNSKRGKRSFGSLSSVGKSIKKGASKVKKAAQLGHTAVQLARHVMNPVNQVKFVAGAVRGKGLVYPGTKYIGPGNPMNLGAPTSKADALAFQHDKDYEDYLSKGYKPKHVYTRYSSADKRLLKEAKKNAHKSHEHLALVLGMGAKKVAHDLGITKSLDNLSNKSSKDVKHKRHHTDHKKKRKHHAAKDEYEEHLRDMA